MASLQPRHCVHSSTVPCIWSWDLASPGLQTALWQSWDARRSASHASSLLVPSSTPLCSFLMAGSRFQLLAAASSTVPEEMWLSHSEPPRSGSTSSKLPTSNNSTVPYCNSKLPFLFVRPLPRIPSANSASLNNLPSLPCSAQLTWPSLWPCCFCHLEQPSCVLLPFWLTTYFPNATWKPIVSTLPCNNLEQLKESNLWLLPKEGSIIISLTFLK